MSQYLFIAAVEPVPPALSAKEHCFAVDVSFRIVIRGWILIGQRAIAIRSPHVVLLSFRRHLCAHESRSTQHSCVSGWVVAVAFLKGLKEI